MKATQKELNEFLLDLAELLGKHFPGWSDKTRVAGGNEGVSIRFRRADAGSELEITSDRLDPFIEYRAGKGDPILIRFRRESASRETLFAAIQSALFSVLADRSAAVRGFKGGEYLGGALYEEDSDERAIESFRGGRPDCDQVTVKRWSKPERDCPPQAP
jgi:hypothetical protein